MPWLVAAWLAARIELDQLLDELPVDGTPLVGAVGQLLEVVDHVLAGGLVMRLPAALASALGFGGQDPVDPGLPSAATASGCRA